MTRDLLGIISKKEVSLQLWCYFPLFFPKHECFLNDIINTNSKHFQSDLLLYVLSLCVSGGLCFAGGSTEAFGCMNCLPEQTQGPLEDCLASHKEVRPTNTV